MRTEFPLGAQVSGTAPASSKLWMAFRAAREVSFGFASSEQHASSIAFSTCTHVTQHLMPLEEILMSCLMLDDNCVHEQQDVEGETLCMGKRL